MSASYKLDDSTIGLFAQLIQLALLTGTDIVDNFRTVQLVDSGEGKLIPDPAFRDVFDANIQKLMAQADALGGEVTEEESSGN
jgi:hypothetical protein